MRRRNIKDTFKQEYGGFCGWKKLDSTLNKIDREDSINIFVGLFQTGARAMELPSLKRNQVDLDFSDTHIMINSMYVEKQRERINLEDMNGEPLYDEKGKRAYILESTEGYRTFPIRKDNPLAPIFIDYVKKFSGDDILYPFSYIQIYYRIALIDMKKGPKTNWNKIKGPWWPHRIRAERACQLIRDLRFDVFRLKKWFGWATSQMPELYGDMVPMDLVDDREVRWR